MRSLGTVMESVVVNLSGRVSRRRHVGRDYLIAPLTMIVPGVLDGSAGPLYYPADELARNAEAWNGTPIVVYHPIVSGLPVSARDPEVLGRSGVGVVYNAVYRDGLRAEGWFDVENTGRVDSRVLDMLGSGSPFELSTGLFTRNEPAPEGATYNGKPYKYTARDYRPDHLAVLPDQVGACSVRDGCGVLVNRGVLVSLTESQRKTIIDRMVNNCACWKDGQDLLNKMTDNQLTALNEQQDLIIKVNAGNYLPIHTPVPVPASVAPVPVAVPVPVQPSGLSRQELDSALTPLLATINMLSTSVQALNAQREAQIEQTKRSLVDTLTRNMVDPQKTAMTAVYNTMTVEQLGVLVANMPAPVGVLPIYAAGGPSSVANSGSGMDEEPLDVPTINYVEESAFAAAERRRLGAA